MAPMLVRGVEVPERMYGTAWKQDATVGVGLERAYVERLERLAG